MISGRRAFFGYYAAANGDVVWFANWPRKPIGPDERASTGDEAWKAQLIELFTEDAGPALDTNPDNPVRTVRLSFLAG